MAYEGDNDYEDISEVISLAGFNWEEPYRCEALIIYPRMREAGFTAISFDNKENSRRIVYATDADMNFRRFYYA